MRIVHPLVAVLAAVLVVPAAAVPEAQAKKGPRVRVLSGAGGAAIGIEAVDLTDDLKKHFGAGDVGVLVGGFTADSPAAKAGMKVGDVVVSVDGAPVDGTFAIIEALADRQAGDEVAVVVVRDKKTVNLKVKVAERPAGWSWSGSAGPHGQGGVWSVGPGVQVHGFGFDTDAVEKLEKKLEQKLEQKLETLEKRLEALEKRTK